MEKKSGDFLDRDADRLAFSPAIGAIIAKLYQENSAEIEKARKLAAAGNSESAVKELSAILNSPEVKSILLQLEESNGGF